MTSVPSRLTAWTLPRAYSGWPAIAFISCSCVAKSSANILLRADSYGPPSSIASAIPVLASVTEVLVITEEPLGMRARPAARAASRPSTTSTLNPCSWSATTVAASVWSSGSVVKRSGAWVVLIVGSSFKPYPERLPLAGAQLETATHALGSHGGHGRSAADPARTSHQSTYGPL